MLNTNPHQTQEQAPTSHLKRAAMGFRELMFPIQIISDSHKKLVKQNLIAIDNGFSDQMSANTEIFTSFTIMYGQWKCNWTCPQFCYTKSLKTEGIQTEKLKILIDRSRDMGAKFTYWPGVGELTLFPEFWEIQAYQTNIKLPAITYSNGSVFVDDALAQTHLGLNANQAIELVGKNPGLHLYIKYWSTDQKLAMKMVGAKDENEIPYVDYMGVQVPTAFARLHAIYGNRIGLQTMVIPENFEDFKKNILPFCLNNNINMFAEPVINSGNARKSLASLLSTSQISEIQQYLASGVNYCQERQYGELILVGNKITPGIAIPPRDQDAVVDSDDDLRSLMEILSDSYFAKYRNLSQKENACVCREYWLQRQV